MTPQTINLLPSLDLREKMLDILLREEYGYLPQKPEKLHFEKEEFIPNFCAGKATSSKITVNCAIGDKKFSFPFYAAIPKKEGKHPFFVMINFRDCIPDLYLPVEELIDNGFGIFCGRSVRPAVGAQF